MIKNRISFKIKSFSYLCYIKNNENKILVYANGTYAALIEKAGEGER